MWSQNYWWNTKCDDKISLIQYAKHTHIFLFHMKSKESPKLWLWCLPLKEIIFYYSRKSSQFWAQIGTLSSNFDLYLYLLCTRWGANLGSPNIVKQKFLEVLERQKSYSLSFNTKEICDASSHLVMPSRNGLWCVSCAFCVSISLPSPAPPVWLLTFSSLHGWSGYWLDLGTQCTNTEIRRERGGQADIAAVPTPLHSPPLAPDTEKKRKTLFFETPLPLSRHPDMVPEHW